MDTSNDILKKYKILPSWIAEVVTTKFSNHGLFCNDWFEDVGTDIVNFNEKTGMLDLAIQTHQPNLEHGRVLEPATAFMTSKFSRQAIPLNTGVGSETDAHNSEIYIECAVDVKTRKCYITTAERDKTVTYKDVIFCDDQGHHYTANAAIDSTDVSNILKNVMTYMSQTEMNGFIKKYNKQYGTSYDQQDIFESIPELFRSDHTMTSIVHDFVNVHVSVDETLELKPFQFDLN